MTKEQFIKRWRPSHLLMLDLEAVIATEIVKVQESQPEPTEQPAPQLSMTYEERVKYIISNKLTHKKAGSESWYAYKFYGYNIHFCDENGKDMIWVRFDELDLTEWYPYKKPFDKERFERMFFASIGIGKFANFSDIILWVETTLQKLDAYYAEKGGSNE